MGKNSRGGERNTFNQTEEGKKRRDLLRIAKPVFLLSGGLWLEAMNLYQGLVEPVMAELTIRRRRGIMIAKLSGGGREKERSCTWLELHLGLSEKTHRVNLGGGSRALEKETLDLKVLTWTVGGQGERNAGSQLGVNWGSFSSWEMVTAVCSSAQKQVGGDRDINH